MEDANSASTMRHIAAWRSRIAATLAGSKQRKVATAVALMLTSLAVFDSTGWDGTKNASNAIGPNSSEDEFEQIEAMLAELERTPDLNHARNSDDNSSTENVSTSSSESSFSGTLRIPGIADDAESRTVADSDPNVTMSSGGTDRRAGDLSPADASGATRGVSYSGSPTATGDRAPRIRLTGTIDPL